MIRMGGHSNLTGWPLRVWYTIGNTFYPLHLIGYSPHFPARRSEQDAARRMRHSRDVAGGTWLKVEA